MTTRARFSTRGAALLAAAAVSVLSQPARGQQAPARPTAPTITVYKSATCGCCRNWVEHMRRAGFDPKVQDVGDINAVKATYGVPPKVSSCHTALAGGYVIEGHVPADVVQRLLRERPQIAGIAVPGMPIGSPGMELGDRRDPYDIISFDKQGKLTVYDSRK